MDDNEDTHSQFCLRSFHHNCKMPGCKCKCHENEKRKST